MGVDMTLHPVFLSLHSSEILAINSKHPALGDGGWSLCAWRRPSDLVQEPTGDISSVVKL